MNKFLLILREQCIYMLDLLENEIYEGVKVILEAHIKFITEMENNEKM